MDRCDRAKRKDDRVAVLIADSRRPDKSPSTRLSGIIEPGRYQRTIQVGLRYHSSYPLGLESYKYMLVLVGSKCSPDHNCIVCRYHFPQHLPTNHYLSNNGRRKTKQYQYAFRRYHHSHLGSSFWYRTGSIRRLSAISDYQSISPDRFPHVPCLWGSSGIQRVSAITMILPIQELRQHDLEADL